MDANLFLIFSFVIIIASIALGVGSAIHRRTNEHEQRKLELKLEIERAKAGDGSSGNANRALEERVRVLERIATDRSPDLAAQIEELRDLQEVDTQIESKERVQ